MSRKSIQRALLSTLLLAAVLFPALTEAGLRGAPRGEDRATVSRIEERGGLFTSLWRGLLSLFEKEGASIDPSGAPKPESGPGTDPSGAPGSGGN